MQEKRDKFDWNVSHKSITNKHKKSRRTKILKFISTYRPDFTKRKKKKHEICDIFKLPKTKAFHHQGFIMKEKTLKNKICDIKNKTSPAADVLFFSKKTRTFFNKKVVTIYVFWATNKIKDWKLEINWKCSNDYQIVVWTIYFRFLWCSQS